MRRLPLARRTRATPRQRLAQEVAGVGTPAPSWPEEASNPMRHSQTQRSIGSPPQAVSSCERECSKRAREDLAKQLPGEEKWKKLARVAAVSNLTEVAGGVAMAAGYGSQA